MASVDVTELQIRVETLEVDKAARQLGRLENQSVKTEKSVGKLGKAFKFGLATGIGAASVAAAKGARNLVAFDKRMREVSSIADVSKARMAQMRKEVLQLSIAMGTDATDSAAALYQALSAGVPQENAINFLKTASQFAIAGVTDTATAVDGLTNVLNAYSLESDKAESVSDDLFTTVKLGKTTVAELSSSMAQATVPAAQLGVTYQEVLAATVSMTKQGVSTSEAMTKQKALFQSLSKPSKELAAAYKAMGIESGEMGVAAFGLIGFMEKLNKQFGGNSNLIQKALGSSESYGGMLSLVGEKGKEASAALDEFGRNTGAAAAAAGKNGGTIEQSMNKLNTALTLVAETGENTFGVLEKLSKYLGKVADGMQVVDTLWGGGLEKQAGEYERALQAWEDKKRGNVTMFDGSATEEIRNAKGELMVYNEIWGEVTKSQNDAYLAAQRREKAGYTPEKAEEIRNRPTKTKTTSENKPSAVAGGGRGGFGRQDPNARDLGMMLGLGTDEDQIQARYERERELILENTRITEQQRTDLMVELGEKRTQDLARVESQSRMMILGAASQTFDGLAGLAQTFAGKQSTAYKVMFGVSKGFALAEAAIALQQNIANASKLGFPQNIPMITSAIAQGTSIVSNISGINPSFQYGGIVGGSSFSGDKVQANVNSGEMVLTTEQQGRLFKMANGQGGSNGGNGGVQVIVNNLPAQDVEVTEKNTENGKQLELTVKKAEQFIGTNIRKKQGDVWRALNQTTNTRPKAK
jgi:TP901 family phage tail tape measure protein